MDTDIIVLMSLLALALSWFLTILITEERQLIKQCYKKEQERQERAKILKAFPNLFQTENEVHLR